MCVECCWGREGGGARRGERRRGEEEGGREREEEEGGGRRGSLPPSPLPQLYSNICKPGLPWNETEACLYVMHAVAPSIRL